MREECVLLRLVEPVQLIHKQDRPLGLHRSPLLRDLDDTAKLGQSAGDGRERLEVRFGMSCDEVGQRCLAGPWRPPKNSGSQRIVFDRQTKGGPRPYDLVLAH